VLEICLPPNTEAAPKLTILATCLSSCRCKSVFLSGADGQHFVRISDRTSEVGWFRALVHHQPKRPYSSTISVPRNRRRLRAPGKPSWRPSDGANRRRSLYLTRHSDCGFDKQTNVDCSTAALQCPKILTSSSLVVLLPIQNLLRI